MISSKMCIKMASSIKANLQNCVGSQIDHVLV
jgi:hypothetical protein